MIRGALIILTVVKIDFSNSYQNFPENIVPLIYLIT